MSRVTAAPPIIRRVPRPDRPRRGLLRVLATPVNTPIRALTVLWLMGLFTVGAVASAYADGDGFLTPDLGGTLAPTVFERIPTSAYTVPFGLSDSQTEFPYVTEAMWNTLRGVTNTVLFVTLYLIRGALLAVQWMFNINFYGDNAEQFDAAVRGLSDYVYWPLLTVTFAIAGFRLVERLDRDRKITGELAWIFLGGTVAIMLVVVPSTVAGTIDQGRVAATNAIMQGYTQAAGNLQLASAAGFPTTDVRPTEKGDAVRGLTDSLWNTFAVTPWCYVSFGDLTVCKDVGKDYLENTDRWQQLYNAQRDMNGDGESAESAKCPPEFGSQCSWVRGQSFARLGAMLFFFVLAVALLIPLLVLAIRGLIALVGFALLVIVGPGFASLMIVAGRLRQIATRFWELFIGTALQGVIVTLLLGGIMITSSILALRIPDYGFWMVAVLNVAVFVMALQFRSAFENLMGGGGMSGGMGGAYMGMQAMRSIGRMGRSTVTTTAKSVGFAGRTGYRGLQGGFNQVLNPGSATNRGVNALAAGAGNATRALRSYMDVPTPMPAPGKPATATPWRGPAAPAPGGQLPVGTPAPAAPAAVGGARVRPALPAAPSAPAAEFRSTATTQNRPDGSVAGRPVTPVAPTRPTTGRPAYAAPARAADIRKPPERIQRHGVWVHSAATPYTGGSNQRDVANRGPGRRPLTSRAKDVIDGTVG